MELNDYQTAAYRFAKYSNFDYPFLALGEEAGEVLGKLAKYGRKNNSSADSTIENIRHPADMLSDKELELKNDLIKELGDVFWQLSACCQELCIDLEEVAQTNLDKLSGRAERGTIVGEGDER